MNRVLTNAAHAEPHSTGSTWSAPHVGTLIACVADALFVGLGRVAGSVSELNYVEQAQN